MPSLTVKGLPEDVIESLRRSAQRNRRSLNSEILYRLEQSVQHRVAEPEAILARIRELRARRPLPELTDDELRRMKDAGRP
jgi:hypothetical protein